MGKGGEGAIKRERERESNLQALQSLSLISTVALVFSPK